MTPSEAFFAAAAQILPTIAIGIIIAESYMINPVELRHEHGRKRLSLTSPRGRFAFAVLFVGECVALVALLFWPLRGSLLTFCSVVVAVSVLLSMLQIFPTRRLTIRRVPFGYNNEDD